MINEYMTIATICVAVGAIYIPFRLRRVKQDIEDEQQQSKK